MLINLLNIVLGFIVLTWSADKLVAGSCALAKNLGVAPLIVGLTIVALGTALPEIVVSILASLSANANLAVGNAIGSNITNIGLVLGVCAIIHPLIIEKTTIRLELPIMVLFAILISALIFFVGLNAYTGYVMLFSALGYVGWLVARGTKQRQENKSLLKEFEEEFQPEMPMALAIFWILLGLVLLVISAQLLIKGAVAIAIYLGVSEVVIGLTLVAFGTSLPELAASVAATLKKEYGIAVGNVIGSNIFNLTAVLCAPAIFSEEVITPKRVFYQDIPVMVLLSVLLFLFAFRLKKEQTMGKGAGFTFLLMYVAYIAAIAFYRVAD